ncbi:helix-turn-helix transcriptional regulator [Pseudonocardia aurantiaca]|uniref:Helix-turn-helix transcriptional regulator n=1 Tax=Pseudonocardia aurantiaca TaxID=75290 RepID=A0ABW4FQ05_9PSEU
MTRNSAMLGAFLRARRGQVVRGELGLPLIGGRASGLRREEVAYLAAVSVTWYTWLEQGRDVAPSRQVLDALARTLLLSTTEHAHLLSLAGYSAPSPVADPVAPTVPGHVRQFLDSLEEFPAYAIAPDWGILAWNAMNTAVYPNVPTVAGSDRNMLWLMFTDPYLRDLLPDWERTARSYVAAFRAEAGPRLTDPPFALLVKRLLEASESFREIWESHSIDVLPTRERLVRHPVLGDLHLRQHNFTPADHPDLHLVIFMPVLGTDTSNRLHRMLDREAATPLRSDSLGVLH